MTVLTDKKIGELLKKGLLIEKGDFNRITSNGYDLLIEDFEVNPGESMLVLSKEKVIMPKNLISLAFLRTTYTFKGLILSSGVIDAGYSGKLKFLITNSSKSKISLEKADNLKAPIHLIFLETSGEVDIPFGMRKGEINNRQ